MMESPDAAAPERKSPAPPARGTPGIFELSHMNSNASSVDVSTDIGAAMRPATWREQAVVLATAGFRVFPLKPGQKIPAFAGWQDQATSNPERARDLWSEALSGDPLDFNIGIATGAGLLVLDVDNKDGKHGSNSVEALELRNDDLPPTLAVITPTGGEHRYFRVSSESWVRNSVGALGEGIDIKGDGGYVVAPGSVIDGVPYVVADDAPIATAPSWFAAIVAAVRPPPRPHGLQAVSPLDREDAVARARVYLRTQAPMAIQGDGGRLATIKVIQKMGDMGMSPTGAALLLTEPGGWNDENADPSWSVDELHSMATDFLTSHRDRPLGCEFLWTGDDEFEAVEIVDRPPAAGDPLHALIDSRQKARSRAEQLAPRNITNLNWAPKSNYAVKGLINYGATGLITGKSNAGKSPVALDLCAHVAMGKDWNGHKVRGGYACYIATEGFTGNANRFEGTRRQYFSDGRPVPFEVIQASIDLRTSTADADAIASAVTARAAVFNVKPALIIVDTLSHTLAGGNESDPEHARAWLKNILRVARTTGAAVLAVHHPPKDGSSLFRGSGFLMNDTDVVIQVETDEKTKIRKVTTPRNKEGAEIEPIQFRIRVVGLGFDDEGEEITTVVVDWLNEVARGEVPRLSPQEQAALTIAVEKSCPENTRDGTAAGIFELGDKAFSVAEISTELNVRGVSKSTEANSLRSAARRLLRTLAEHGLVENVPNNQGFVLTNNAEQRANIREIVRAR